MSGSKVEKPYVGNKDEKAGKKFEDLEVQEMEAVQGAGDTEGQTISKISITLPVGPFPPLITITKK